MPSSHLRNTSPIAVCATESYWYVLMAIVWEEIYKVQYLMFYLMRTQLYNLNMLFLYQSSKTLNLIIFKSNIINYVCFVAYFHGRRFENFSLLIDYHWRGSILHVAGLEFAILYN